MSVRIKKGKGTSTGFDPTPVLGWTTYIVAKDHSHTYEVLKYDSKKMTLKSATGHIFKSNFIEGITELRYDVFLIKDPKYNPPKVVVKSMQYQSVLAKTKE